MIDVRLNIGTGKTGFRWVGDIVQTETACIVCREENKRGIMIFGKFLCMECEQDIVATDVSDPRYAYYIECMKEIWLAATS